jgi:ankyrin repeat domain-containing protein 17
VHLYISGGHVECVQLLVNAGADVHAEDNRRVSCIMAAFRKAHIKVVKVLVRHVTQFPPDQDCLRYIATLSDKVCIIFLFSGLII